MAVLRWQSESQSSENIKIKQAIYDDLVKRAKLGGTEGSDLSPSLPESASKHGKQWHSISRPGRSAGGEMMIDSEKKRVEEAKRKRQIERQREELIEFEKRITQIETGFSELQQREESENENESREVGQAVEMEKEADVQLEAGAILTPVRSNRGGVLSSISGNQMITTPSHRKAIVGDKQDEREDQFDVSATKQKRHRVQSLSTRGKQMKVRRTRLVAEDKWQKANRIIAEVTPLVLKPKSPVARRSQHIAKYSSKHPTCSKMLRSQLSAKKMKASSVKPPTRSVKRVVVTDDDEEKPRSTIKLTAETIAQGIARRRRSLMNLTLTEQSKSRNDRAKKESKNLSTQLSQRYTSRKHRARSLTAQNLIVRKRRNLSQQSLGSQTLSSETKHSQLCGSDSSLRSEQMKSSHHHQNSKSRHEGSDTSSKVALSAWLANQTKDKAGIGNTLVRELTFDSIANSVPSHGGKTSLSQRYYGQMSRQRNLAKDLCLAKKRRKQAQLHAASKTSYAFVYHVMSAKRRTESLLETTGRILSFEEQGEKPPHYHHVGVDAVVKVLFRVTFEANGGRSMGKASIVSRNKDISAFGLTNIPSAGNLVGKRVTVYQPYHIVPVTPSPSNEGATAGSVIIFVNGGAKIHTEEQST